MIRSFMSSPQSPIYSGSERSFFLRAGIVRLSNGGIEDDRYAAEGEVSIAYVRTEWVEPRCAMRAFPSLQAKKLPFLTSWASLGWEEVLVIVSVMQ
jgi:hypothetical protein